MPQPVSANAQASPHSDRLVVELLSDASFSRGEGTAGAVDSEVEHDEFGMPFIRGKSLRGLLRDAWLAMRDCFPDLATAATAVWGADATLHESESAILRVGDARVPEAIRQWIEFAVCRKDHPLRPEQVLSCYTPARALRRRAVFERLSRGRARNGCAAQRAASRLVARGQAPEGGA